MINFNFKYKDLLQNISEAAPFQPEVSLILGSGLGGFANNISIEKTISTTELPVYPPSTIHGHEGKIHFGLYEGKKLLLFQGRIHYYEGYSISDCILPSLISSKLGCKKILLTNAAGGINYNFVPGDLMLSASFNGLQLKKDLTDLIGLASVDKKELFLDFPSKSFNQLIKDSALQEKINLKEGIYWFTTGPSYETPAEIKMMEKFGADAVGMSTVHEAVFAAYLGMEAASISCITNYAAGISQQKLSHSEVTETANLVQDKFERLVKRIVKNIHN